MRAWLTRSSLQRRTARSLYGSIVTQARQPVLYAEWGIPDTAQGRLEMIVLHLALVLQRLAQEGESGKRLGRALTEEFVCDMDDAMREMTFGDLAVPREVKRIAAALFDRHNAYAAALREDQDAPLEAALSAQLAYLQAPRMDVAHLAHYMRDAARSLAQQPARGVLAGELAWPGLAAPAIVGHRID
jgi:cytochrome b pre-mRNA-processing protein 3